MPLTMKIKLYGLYKDDLRFVKLSAVGRGHTPDAEIKLCKNLKHVRIFRTLAYLEDK